MDLIKDNLKDLVDSSIEETLNALLDHEAHKLVKTEKYERSGERQGYRSGHYSRNFSTTAGDVRLKMPKFKGVPFETAIIERYKRRETSLEEALIEMYLSGVSVRRVEDITQALWGTKVSPHRHQQLESKKLMLTLKSGVNASWRANIPVSILPLLGEIKDLAFAGIR